MTELVEEWHQGVPSSCPAPTVPSLHMGTRDTWRACSLALQLNGVPVIRSLSPSFRKWVGGGARAPPLPQEALPNEALGGHSCRNQGQDRDLRRLTQLQQAQVPHEEARQNASWPLRPSSQLWLHSQPSPTHTSAWSCTHPRTRPRGIRGPHWAPTQETAIEKQEFVPGHQFVPPPLWPPGSCPLLPGFSGEGPGSQGLGTLPQLRTTIP